MMEQPAASSETVSEIVRSDTQKARILREMLLADLGISDVTIKSVSGKKGESVITTTHRMIDDDGNTEHFQLLMELHGVVNQQHVVYQAIFVNQAAVLLGLAAGCRLSTTAPCSLWMKLSAACIRCLPGV